MTVSLVRHCEEAKPTWQSRVLLGQAWLDRHGPAGLAMTVRCRC